MEIHPPRINPNRHTWNIHSDIRTFYRMKIAVLGGEHVRMQARLLAHKQSEEQHCAVPKRLGPCEDWEVGAPSLGDGGWLGKREVSRMELGL